MGAIAKLAPKENPFVHELRFECDRLIICFIDGTEMGIPLAWFPKLYYATPRQLSQWRVVGNGLHIRWADLDEDVSVEALLA